MSNSGWLSAIVSGSLILLCFTCCCLGAPDNPGITATGQVVWNDIEGGFYGIITPDGTRYQPVNLPDPYKVSGFTVNFTGRVSDVATIQMWGEPIEISTIGKVNENNPFLRPWYQADNTGTLTDGPGSDLLKTAAGLQNGLDSIDLAVSSIARNISAEGSFGRDNTELLNRGLAVPGILEITLIDRTGKIKAIVPEENKRFQGEDVSFQEFNAGLIKYPAPGMSGFIPMVEGMDAVIISWPVFSDHREVTGFVSALVDPANLSRTTAIQALNGTGLDLMVAQPDGKILYDEHPDMNGQVITNNSVFSGYPDLLAWAAHFQNAQAGIDRYSFYKEDSPDVVTTDVTWTTVALHGTPWRVCLLRR